MNVLMYGWELPPHNWGGLGVACAGLTKGLSNQGINLTFVLPSQQVKDVDYDYMNLKYTHLSSKSDKFFNSLIKSYSTSSQYQEILKQIKENANQLGLDPEQIKIFGNTLVEEALRYGQKASHWAKTVKHDLIHTHDWLSYPAGIQAARTSGKPLIAHVHATQYDHSGRDFGDPRIREIEAFGMQQADKVITVSNYTKDVVVDQYGIKPNKIEVVHNGVDVSEFPPTNLPELLPGYQVVLFVGRLTIQKGPDYFLKAAKRVLEYRPKTIFIVAGHGSLYQQLVMQAAQLGISHRVFFPGFVRGEQRTALYQHTDLFVMPSVSEPFGIVPLEAMINGKPVIVSKQSGVSEVINHAFKVDFWDTEKLSAQIISLLQYQELHQEMSRNAQMEVEHINWDNAAAKTVGIYKQLVR